MMDESVLFVVPGDPRGYTTTNRNARPSKAYLRYVAFMEHVRLCARAAGLSLPLIATRDYPLNISTIAFFRNGNHCDPENVRKGVTDALFYRGHLPKGKRKGDDKHTGGSFLPPLYDKTNPRTLVIIEPCESIQLEKPK